MLLVIVLFTDNIFYLQQLFQSSELVSLLGIVCFLPYATCKVTNKNTKEKHGLSIKRVPCFSDLFRFVHFAGFPNRQK